MINTLRSQEELWDLFTRKAEYPPHHQERTAGGTDASYSLEDPPEPVVSKFLTENGLDVRYPDDRPFAVCLTHDIDAVYLSPSNICNLTGRSLRKGEIRTALTMPFCNRHRPWNPWWNFSAIMDLEEQYGAVSSFYLMALSEGEEDYNYPLADLSSEMGIILDRGCEIGLHGGHQAFRDAAVLHEEKRRLEQALGKRITGYRNHFLKFSVPGTWELLAEAGFSYDSTLGNARCAGFRNGMCHPFRPFNLETNAEIGILEIPLLLMDRTICDFMSVDPATAWRIAKSLLDTVAAYHGGVTILWHNNCIKDRNFRFYRKILEYCAEKNAWLTSGAELCTWWERHG
jgi:hypothetical protein